MSISVDSKARARARPFRGLCLGSLALSYHATGAAQAVLEEVMVTAEKRTESLQDVGLSVTALSADRLEQNLQGPREDARPAPPRPTRVSDRDYSARRAAMGSNREACLAG